MTADTAMRAGALYQQAERLASDGRYDEARSLCRQALQLDPRHHHSMHLLGVIAARTGHARSAADWIGRAVATAPQVAELHNNLGNALLDLSQAEKALHSYDRAIALNAAYAGAHNNRGNALAALKRWDEALASYDSALALQPTYANAWYNRGNALRALKRLQEALDAYRRATELEPRYADAHNNAGSLALELRQFPAALASLRSAISLRGDNVEAINNLGSVLHELQAYDQAIALYERAAELSPASGTILKNLAHALYDAKRYPAAAAAYERALGAGATDISIRSMRLLARVYHCDWDGISAEIDALEAGVLAGTAAANPFLLIGVSRSTAAQRRVAEELYAQVRAELPHNTGHPAPAPGTRLRIGYFSSDFFDHATMHLLAGVFELHDRSQFEITAYSIGAARHDAMRTRVIAACERFVDVNERSDDEIVALARDANLDIAVDLKGFTQESRAGLFARRLAPVQIGYLGYPGPMGAGFNDYLIADRITVPPLERDAFGEKIITLPGTYQANDRRREIAERVWSRAELGLPERGFVYCCFNNNFKILPGMFDVWTKILKAVEGSVLWLYEDNADATANLRREATARGLESSRLVFAPRVPLPLHLARYRAADLFLDTLPCNAHTTASDALWAGVPILTQLGTTFAGRVAASLLHAAGLPELVVEDSARYEAMAIALARDTARLAELRDRLACARLGSRLFDTERITRELELAYGLAVGRYRDGLPPDHIDVPEIDARPGA